MLVPPKRYISAAVALFALLLFTFTLLKVTDNEYIDRIHSKLNPSEVHNINGDDAEEFYELRSTLNDNYAKINEFPPVPLRRNRYQGTNKPDTPLLIGFGRNWFMLQQCIVAYIAAGWPAHEITVIDNSGVMDSNIHNLLTPSNPAYINYARLAELGVNYQRTPTLLTFSQLQNFYLSTALENGWDYYLWSHMDVVVFSDEEKVPYRSFYHNVVEDIIPTIKNLDNWALHFYRFDWLTLVNTKSYNILGGFDPAIPYYTSDCDFYSRVNMYGAKHKNGFKLEDIEMPIIFDVADTLSDLSIFFGNTNKPALGPRPTPISNVGHQGGTGAGEEEEPLNSPRYRKLRHTMEHMKDLKGRDGGERNTWQTKQSGGRNEPYSRGAWILNEAFWRFSDLGKEIFEKKWRTGGQCAVEGRTFEDMYAQEKKR